MCDPEEELPRLDPGDVHRAAIHEASHALVASKYCDFVRFYLLPPEAVEVPEGAEQLGTVGGQAVFPEISDAIGRAAVAWAGFFGERIADSRSIGLQALMAEAKERLRALAPLDWEALDSVTEEARRHGAQLAYDMLNAEWALVEREAGLLEEVFRPPSIRARIFEHARGWRWF